MGASLGGGGGRRKRNNRADSFSEINITPMVDVMLVLLIIFMVAAPMMTSGVTVDLPKANSTPLQGTDEPLVVTVTTTGKIYIQKTLTPLKELKAKLSAIAEAGQKKETRIFVRGDENVDYGKMMKVVSEINSAGFGRVALITDTGGDLASDKR